MNAKNIFGAITVAVALFFVWPAVFGSWAEVRALRDALAERTQLVSSRAAILEQFTKEYAKLSTIKNSDTGRNFLATVPTGRSTAELVSAVQEIAATSGLQVDSVQASSGTASVANRPYQTMALKIEVSGSYTAFRAFLKGLEDYVRVLSVNKMQITADAATGRLSFVVTADTYFIK